MDYFFIPSRFFLLLFLLLYIDHPDVRVVYAFLNLPLRYYPLEETVYGILTMSLDEIRHLLYVQTVHLARRVISQSKKSSLFLHSRHG